jgi:hypothetical protein
LRALLDTHALLWWLSDDPALPRSARKLIAETKNTLVVSAGSAWEIAIKVGLGKLPTAADLAADFSGLMEREGFELLPSMVFGLGFRPVLTKIHSTECLLLRPRLRIFQSSATKRCLKDTACGHLGDAFTDGEK